MEPETPATPGPSADNDSLIGLLRQLTEPAEPPPVSMMPQTWGWAVLAALLLAALLYVLWRWQRHYRANAYRRAAQRMLQDAGDDPARVAEILRRTALVAYPRDKVASLSGTDWLAFLDRQVGGEAFLHGPGQVVATAPYRPANPDPQVTGLALSWVRKHRAEPA
jgi:hypothetical protein